MNEVKRVTLFAGHYGSGKTNVALNYARRLKRNGHAVAIGDLDIVNPYFRTKDSHEALSREGIRLVVSDFANSNVDFPALPKEIYGLFAGRGEKVVVDVGGDDRGALALGRYVPDIREENDYAMLAVVNASRPLTATPSDTVDVLREIEAACALPFSGVVNNTNLGPQTTAETVLGSLGYAQAVAAALGVPVAMTAVRADLAPSLEGRIPDLFPLQIQELYYQLRETDA